MGTKQDTMKSTIKPMSLNSSRTWKSSENAADISVHAATCQSCIDKAYTQGEAIMRNSFEMDSFLFSLRNARDVALKVHSLNRLRSTAKLHGRARNVT